MNLPHIAAMISLDNLNTPTQDQDAAATVGNSWRICILIFCFFFCHAQCRA